MLKEKSLHQDNETLELIMNAALDAIICMNSQGCVTRWNRQAEKIFGWKASEAEGQQMSELIIPDDYKERHHTAFRNYREKGEKKIQNRLVEITARHRNGHIFPIELTIVPIKQEDDEFFCAFIRDITARKKTEEELLQSEQRYRSLIDQASDAIMITDGTGIFTDVNAGLCRMFNYTREELIGNNIRMLIDADEYKNHPIGFEALLKGIPVLRERKMVHRDGTIIEVEANVKLIADGRILAIARDISERKKTENALRESELRFRSIAEYAPLAIACFSITKEVVFINKRFTQLTGYEIKDIPTVNDFNRLAYPDESYRERMYNFWFSHTKTAANLDSDDFMMEVSIHCKNGETIIAEATRTIYKDRIYVVANDITERKKAEDSLRLSEQKYKLLFNKNPLPMWMFTSAHSKIIDVNESAVFNYGYTKEEFLSMTPKDLRPEEEIERFLEEVNNKTLNENGYTGIWKHRKKNGEVIKVEVIAHDIIYDDQPARLALALDVTEKIKAEENLRLSHRELRRLSSHLENIREEERTNIAREIHDELGQQLTGLKMDARWLQKKISANDRKVQEKLEDMISQIDDTVITVRRISSELRPGILDDLGLTDALDWQCTEFEKRTGIRCLFKTSVGELIFEKKMATGIFRIYQETLTNAARHSMANEINTSLSLLDDRIVLKVTDNGIGFTDAEIKEKNTLGLVGMKERASMIGAELMVESIKEKGTTILLNIPLTAEVLKI